jgi:hypothetical protein
MTEKRPRTAINLLALMLSASSSSCVSVDLVSTQRTQDSGALANLRNLLQGERNYYAANGRYTRHPKVAGLAFEGSSVCAKGYCYVLAAKDDSFQIQARPEVWGRSGYRSFYANQHGTITYTLENRLGNAADRLVE